MQKKSPMAFHSTDPRVARLRSGATEYEAEGGRRGSRWPISCQLRFAGVRYARDGVQNPAAGRLQAPIIITFHMPANPDLISMPFTMVSKSGLRHLPGKLTVADSSAWVVSAARSAAYAGRALCSKADTESVRYRRDNQLACILRQSTGEVSRFLLSVGGWRPRRRDDVTRCDSRASG